MGETNSPDGERVRTTGETSRSRSVEWLLLTGHRGGIALSITGLFAAFFTGLVLLGVVPLEHTQPLFSAYTALIVGNLTLITVIVSINQLFLSRELQAPGELETKIEAIVEYRKGIEHTAGEITPATPLRFLRILVEATRQDAQQVGGFAKDGVVTSGNEEIDDVVMTLTDQMDLIDARLTKSSPDTFNVLSIMLEENYAQQIYKLRTIQAEHADDIAGIAHEADRRSHRPVAGHRRVATVFQINLPARRIVRALAIPPVRRTPVRSRLDRCPPHPDSPARPTGSCH